MTFAEVASYADPISLAGQARELLARMESSGVTTILYSGDPLAPQNLTDNATAQGYFPEWVITGSALVDTSIFARTYDQEQWQHAFGPSNLFARVAPDVAGAAFLYRWFFDEAPPARTGSALVLPNLQFFYAVLQGIGPELTHEAFREVIFNAAIVEGNVLNPQISWGSAGSARRRLRRGGRPDRGLLGPRRRGGRRDRPRGERLWTYVDGGRRYLPGGWPDTPPRVFDPDGAVTVYTELPPGITLPEYEPLPSG